MSSRTIARSSSNMNSASARASSVLPTPVGPRNTKLPTGRFGFFSPARERRIAREIAFLGGPLNGFVPELVEERLRRKVSSKQVPALQSK